MSAMQFLLIFVGGPLMVYLSLKLVALYAANRGPR